MCGKVLRQPQKTVTVLWTPGGSPGLQALVREGEGSRGWPVRGDCFVLPRGGAFEEVGAQSCWARRHRLGLTARPMRPSFCALQQPPTWKHPRAGWSASAQGRDRAALAPLHWEKLRVFQEAEACRVRIWGSQRAAAHSLPPTVSRPPLCKAWASCGAFTGASLVGVRRKRDVQGHFC